MFLALLLLACHPAPDDTEVQDVCDVTPTGQVTLPADDAPHDEAIEWWYWTGHLVDDQGRRYGFEHTFFRFALGFFDSTVANVAVTDIDAAVFSHDEPSVDTLPTVTEGRIDLQVAANTATGEGGSDVLHSEIGDYVLDLSLAATKPPVLQHGDGYHDYDVGGHTWYYSRERMSASGTLTVDGSPRTVTGEAWFDHQWGQLTQASTAGWDWFAIQLDDDREIMLFLVRGGDDVIGGSYVDEGCNVRELGPSDLAVTETGSWTSPHTGCTYPQGWEIDVLDLHLVISPVLADQEVANPYNTYWEGASVVSGDASGRAYVELAGYCADNPL